MKRHLPNRGISLLEVLISLGVVAIGLLGAISLMPLAGHSVQQASLATRKGQVGRRAIDEFTLRGMNDYRSWVGANGNRAVTDPYNVYGSGGNLLPAYCIDPLYVLARGNKTFPEDPQGGVSMPRVTLRMPAPLGGVTPTAITRPLAEQIFVEQDQLYFENPTDNTLPPMQQYVIANNKNLKRQQLDRPFSWFATLTRSASSFPDQYRLSIAVCYNRDIAPSTQATNLSEQSVQAEPFGSGFGGGPFKLIDRQVLNPLTNKQEWILHRDNGSLNIRPGQWLMLYQNFATGPVFQWYRILDTHYDKTVADVVEITLDGPDWPVSEFVPGQLKAVVFPSTSNSGGVLAVYEKTITLESTSLWID